jgi:hypothetical protein
VVYVGTYFGVIVAEVMQVAVGSPVAGCWRPIVWPSSWQTPHHWSRELLDEDQIARHIPEVRDARRLTGRITRTRRRVEHDPPQSLLREIT